jgi:hypothetical protein
MTTTAFVCDGRLGILAVSQLGRALYAPVFDGPDRPANPARFAFLDPRAAGFSPAGTTPPTPPSRCCTPKLAVTPATAA